MQDRIKELAREAGFNLDPDTGLILDTAGIYSVDDAVRALAMAVACECAAIAFEVHHLTFSSDVTQLNIVEAIRARFGIK